MSANDKQIDGDHYQSDVQHWDVIAIYGIGYLEGCATKYITRHRNKNGLKDIEKAVHYVEKMIELAQSNSYHYRPRGIVPMNVIKDFSEANELRYLEEEIVTTLLRWDNRDHLDKALWAINALLDAETELAKQLEAGPF